MNDKMTRRMNQEMQNKADFNAHKSDAMAYLDSSYFACETPETLDKAIASLRNMRRILVKANGWVK